MKLFPIALLAAAAAAVAGLGMLARVPAAAGVDKPAYHYDSRRSGWNDREAALTPLTVGGGTFGLLWQSPRLDAAGDVPARLFASPLYLSGLDLGDGRTLSLAYVVTSAGYAYAINTAPAARLKPGAIVWRKQLSLAPCDKGMMGNLSTPVIDRAKGRIYVTSCSGTWDWTLHALDVRSGKELPGWPLAINQAMIEGAGLNRNGAKRFTAGSYYFQRGALTLRANGDRVYLAFGPDQQGWLVSVDTRAARVASAFSSTARIEEEQGGMWGSSGPAIDGQGRIYIATGASVMNTLAKGGIPGVYPQSPHSWGQSVLQFRDDPARGLQLQATYSPYNYCQTAASDIDIAGSGVVVIDPPRGITGTPRLLALGPGKQGNAYLLDRDHLPGNAVRRQGCSRDPATDRSLLAPEKQPELGGRGPVNVFGPFSDSIGMINSAKSRSTMAQYRDGRGVTHLFMAGSTKTGPDFSTNVPPGLVRLKLVTAPGKPAFLRKDGAENIHVFQNPGSPVVSSHHGKGAIVWLMDTNAARSVDLFQPGAPHPILYAFDAKALTLLWDSGSALFPSGKYNEPAVVDGLVLVGTDRLQAFGLGGTAAPRRTAVAAPAQPRGEKMFQERCAGCHSGGEGGAPPLRTLAAFPRARIVDALTRGKMKTMAEGMTRAEIDQIAAYLVKTP